jgi:uncharacterized protein YjiS (DUF1127 family)
MINQTITAIVHAVTAYKVERRTIKELNFLSDRELSDIGICRADIPAIAKYDVTNKMPATGKMFSWYSNHA